VQTAFRIQVGLIVEVRRCPEETELQTVRVIAALHVVAPAIGVRDVGAELQVVRHAMRAIHPDGYPGEVVVGSNEDAVVSEVLAREIEESAFRSAGHRQVVVRGKAGSVGLVGMIEDGCSGAGQVRPPTPQAAGRAELIASPRRWRNTAQPLPEPGLKGIVPGDIVDSHRRPE
jgi:hypothetical protein